MEAQNSAGDSGRVFGRILDQACGTGILTLKIARRFPQARIIGVDLTDEYLRVARRKAEALGLNQHGIYLGHGLRRSVRI